MPWNKNDAEGFGLIISAGDLALAEITSDIMDTRKLNTMSFILNLTRAGGGVTGVVMEVDCAPTALGPWGPIQDQAETPPDKALVTQTWTKSTIAGNLIWAFNLTEIGPTLGGPFVRVRLAPVAGAAGDIIDVHCYAEA